MRSMHACTPYASYFEFSISLGKNATAHVCVSWVLLLLEAKRAPHESRGGRSSAHQLFLWASPLRPRDATQAHVCAGHVCADVPDPCMAALFPCSPTAVGLVREYHERCASVLLHLGEMWCFSSLSCLILCVGPSCVCVYIPF